MNNRIKLTDAIELSDAPIARTNILDIQGNLAEHIARLLRIAGGESGSHVVIGQWDFTKERKESTQEFESRIHREIKRLIRRKLELDDKTPVAYETHTYWEKGKKLVFFFYLSPKPVDNQVLIDRMVTSNRADRLFQGLIGLHLKLDLIQEVQNLYDLEPAYFNSELYLGVENRPNKNDNDAVGVIDTFFPSVYVSKENELIITLHRRVFRYEAVDHLRAVIDDTTLVFRKGPKQYRVNDIVDARSESKKVFMDFGNRYIHCQNRAQNLLMKRLMTILKQCDIHFEHRHFQANLVLDRFLSHETEPSRPLIVINTLTDDALEPKHRDALTQALATHLSPEATKPSKAYPSLKHLNLSKNYLIVNKSLKKNGSSVSVDGKPKNTFWDALDAVQAQNGVTLEQLDFYSRLKYEWLKSDVKHVLQGINVENKAKAYSAVKLARLKTELWLKEGVFAHSRLEGISLPDAKLTLIYIRHRNNNEFRANVVDLMVKNSVITLEPNEIFRTTDRLIHRCPYLKCRKDNLRYNGTFILYDKSHQVFLFSYNSRRIPELIGNAEIDEGSISRTTKPGQNILPYYLVPKERKQYHHIYLQERSPDLLYFVSSYQKPNQTIANQNRVYNILVFNEKEELLRALEQPITNLYLRSFTENILRVNEVSKSSLLEKIARLPLEN